MKYSNVTQRTINYIEQHLTSKMSLDDFAKNAGYSKFHLTRVFKQEVGMAISEYIRMRRLAVAAMLLMHSEESILMIALELQFQSQEAFTRSFRETYAMPPGKYRKMMKTLIGLEENEMENESQAYEQSPIKGWFLSGSHPWHYTIGVDEKVFHSGAKSGVLQSSSQEVEDTEQFGTMMQSFQADDYLGKRLKMSCYLKSEDAYKCAAWCRVDNAAGDSIQFDNMHNRLITGTTEWNYYSIVLDVPEDSASIHFGVLLIGKGKVWADGFRFEVVDHKTPVTNTLDQVKLPKQPLNLDFSE